MYNHKISWRLTLGQVDALAGAYSQHLKYRWEGLLEYLIRISMQDILRRLMLMAVRMHHSSKATLTLTEAEAALFMKYWAGAYTEDALLSHVLICKMVQDIDKKFPNVKNLCNEWN